MCSVHTPAANFSLAQARHIVKDLFAPDPRVYWADFLLSLGIGAAAFWLVRRVPLFSPGQLVLFATSAVLYYRAALFIHELTHLRAGTFRAFRLAWNALCGIPFLMPSFLYHAHCDHHQRKNFGTQRDDEYLALGTTTPIHLLAYLCQPLVIPLLAIVRFGLLAPLSWLSPALRRFVHRRASSLAMDPSYIRPLPTRKMVRIIRLQEALCCSLVWLVGARLVRGIMPLGFLIQAYLTAVTIIMLNHVRTLGAHRYTNRGGEMSFVEQLLDSVNFPSRSPWTFIWAPVGLRYHALHHLFPSLPYHRLREAHERLMAELPADSPYRLTQCASLSEALRQLWRTCCAVRKQAGADAQHSRPAASSPTVAASGSA